MPEVEEDAIGIKELSEDLSRSPTTIRQWLRERKLPRELRPKKVGGRKQLTWRPDQLDGLREFAKEREERKGWQH